MIACNRTFRRSTLYLFHPAPGGIHSKVAIFGGGKPMYLNYQPGRTTDPEPMRWIWIKAMDVNKIWFHRTAFCIPALIHNLVPRSSILWLIVSIADNPGLASVTWLTSLSPKTQHRLIGKRLDISPISRYLYKSVNTLAEWPTCCQQRPLPNTTWEVVVVHFAGGWQPIGHCCTGVYFLIATLCTCTPTVLCLACHVTHVVKITETLSRDKNINTTIFTQPAFPCSRYLYL